MADEIPTTPAKRAASTRKTGTSATSRKPATSTLTAETPSMTSNTLTPATGSGSSTGTGTGTNHKAEAKSRFNAAVQEAKAGAAALKAEATERAGAYRGEAEQRGKDWVSDAKTYRDDAAVKGKDLAAQGKQKVSGGLNALGQTIDENAHVVDEKLGAKYGDYARSASRSIQQAATRLDEKSVDELGEDARAFVRKSPATAVGIAAVFGFMLSRLFTGSRN